VPEPLFTNKLLPEFNMKLPQVADTPVKHWQNGTAPNASAAQNATLNDLIGAAASAAKENDAPSEDTIALERQSAEELAKIADRLPSANRHVLHWLGCHLRRVSAHADINKMTLSNLGLIFCPTLGISSLLFRMFVQYVDIILPMLHDCKTNTQRRQLALARQKEVTKTSIPNHSNSNHNDEPTLGTVKDTTLTNDTSTLPVQTPPPKPPRSSTKIFASPSSSSLSSVTDTETSPPALPPRPSTTQASRLTPAPSNSSLTASTTDAVPAQTTTPTHTAPMPSPPPVDTSDDKDNCTPPPKPSRSATTRKQVSESNPSTHTEKSDAISNTKAAPLLTAQEQARAANAVVAAAVARYESGAEQQLGLVSFNMVDDNNGIESGLLNLIPRIRNREFQGGRLARARAIFERH
jgi:hypothetical protein